jgi:hypothetical protein
VAKNTVRQLAKPRIAAIAGGATTAPTAVPALMMPIASERSRAGNHSETALVAAGNPPPSPTPRRKRLTISDRKPVARPWLAEAIDQPIITISRPRRVPSRSTRAPPPAYMTAYASRNAACSWENCVLVSGMSRCTAAIATDSDCRSR